MKYLFKHILFIASSICFVWTSMAQQNGAGAPTLICIQHATHSYGANSLNQFWMVPTNVLGRQPRWNGTAPPPLSESNAVAIALTEVENKYQDISKWRIDQIMLRNLSWDKQLKTLPYCSNVWYYAISFVPQDDDKTIELTDAGRDSDLLQAVLLDGTLVKSTTEPVRLKSRLMLDVRNLLIIDTNGPVNLKQLPDSVVQRFDPKRAFITNCVLIIYTSDDSGWILNPASSNSIPNIPGFMILPIGENPGVFDFVQKEEGT